MSLYEFFSFIHYQKRFSLAVQKEETFLIKTSKIQSIKLIMYNVIMIDHHWWVIKNVFFFFHRDERSIMLINYWSLPGVCSLFFLSQQVNWLYIADRMNRYFKCKRKIGMKIFTDGIVAQMKINPSGQRLWGSVLLFSFEWKAVNEFKILNEFATNWSNCFFS